MTNKYLQIKIFLLCLSGMLLFVTNFVAGSFFYNESWTESIHPGQKYIFLRRQRILSL